MVGGERVLGGRYVLEERIAAGGMGTVYAATDRRLGRRVAVKLLKDELAGDDRYGSAEGGKTNPVVARFEREARAAAALSHPNVAGVFDYGEDEGVPFIVMELVAGRDLARVLREEGPLAPERARAIARGLCAALAHAHAAGLVHRDVKPANVIVGDDGRVKVTDFGIARAAGDSSLTVTGSVLGSAQYMAPEQASGAPVTPAADVYAAGIVLYEMLTSSVPFTGDSPVSVAMRHVSDDVPPPSRVNPRVPAELDAVVERATAKDPKSRFPSAAAMAQALAGERAQPVAGSAAETTQVIGPGGATAPTTVWPIPGARYDPRRLGARVLATAAVLAVLAAGVWVWLLTRSDDDQATPPATQRAGAVEPAATERAEPTSEAYVLPELAGMPFKEAEKQLEEQGLIVEPSPVPSEAEKDEVVYSEPPAGAALRPGDTVTLAISTGQPEEEAGEGDDEGDEGDEEGPGNSENAPGRGKDKDKEKDEE
ncbi:MAG TPA: protein kinase [Actinomycetota bacterium]|nr:protein kinase [Actinomycetota bacterium]